MSRVRLLTIAVLVVGTACSAPAVLAAGSESEDGPNVFRDKISATLKVNSDSRYSGRLAARQPCRDDREVVVRSATDGSELATDMTGSKGHWSAQTSFTGPVTIKVRRKYVQVEFDEQSDNPKTDRDDFIFCKRARTTSAPAPAPSADLGLTKTPDGGSSSVDATYTVTVTNAGPGQAKDVIVTDTPSAVSRYDPAASDSRCSVSGSTIVCSLGTVAAGATVPLTLVFAYNRQPECVSVTSTNQATVASATPDPNASNNSDSGSVSFSCD
jgi:hypothetical protein